MKVKKYERPNFLTKLVTQENYEKWLQGKASAHIKRDKKRGNRHSTGQDYKEAIHKAVCESNGLDAYTGKQMNWNLIKSFNNAEAKQEGRRYKAKFADMPTLDHVEDGKENPNFKICSWKVNGAKSDLSLDEFIDLCKSIIKFNQQR